MNRRPAKRGILRARLLTLASAACLCSSLTACDSKDESRLSSTSSGAAGSSSGSDGSGSDGSGLAAGGSRGASDAGVGANADGNDAGSVVPDTAAGRQLAWVLELLDERGGVAAEPELREHFASAFLMAVPPDVLAQTLSSLGAAAPYALVEVRQPSPTQLQARVDTAAGPELISLSIEASTGLIGGLLFQPDLERGRPSSWDEVDAAVSQLAARSDYLVARVDGGTCTELHAAHADERLALGSAFKLYVLAEVVRQIGAGTLSWSDAIVIEDALKSIPSGQLQDLVAGTQVQLLDVATLMISISDNTAADHLIARLGRENVEAVQSLTGHGAPELNVPFLTTRELSLFKLNLPSADVDAYLADDVAAKRAFLDGLAGQAPDLAALAQWTEPRRIDQLEWFASATDLCHLMAALDVSAAQPGLEPLRGVLSKNPGAPIDTTEFPFVAFKGGSEPGVLNATWLVQRSDGARFFVGLGLNDPLAPLTDPMPAVRVALGMFDLVARE